MGALLLVVGTVCALFVGVALWEICRTSFIMKVPAAVGHPMKLRVLYLLFRVVVAWGTIFEKLRICSMPKFVRFLHDLQPVRKDPDVVVKDLHFGTVPVKLYQPRASSRSLRPGILFIHGGGTILGSLKLYHKVCCHLSKESDSVIVAIGYRKAPEHKFPVILTDCLAVTILFLKSLDTYGVDPARVVICGDSIGGGLATVICQELLNSSDLPKIRAQIMVYAPFQILSFHLPSYQQNRNVPMLTLDFIFQGIAYYLDISPTWKSAFMNGAHIPAEIWEKHRKWLGSENIPERFRRGYQPMPAAPLDEVAYAEIYLLLNLIDEPLVAEDEIVSRLPEACIISCEYDPLRDNSLLYKKRLEDVGVRVTWHHMEDGFHGVLNTFKMGYFHFPCSVKILNIMIQFIKEL